MKTDELCISIMVAEIKDAVAAASPSKRIVVAVREARKADGAGMFGDITDDQRLKAAAVALHPHLNEDEREQLKSEFSAAAALAAAMSGVPVNFAALEGSPEPLGLIKEFRKQMNESATPAGGRR